MPRLTVNGAALHYELAGRGRPAFVLVHGGCCAASDWGAQIEALAIDGSVLALDLRGHGRSEGAETALTVPQWAADVNALVTALDIGEAVIVGHSLGARIAAEAAWQAPGRYAGLVLVDGSRTVGGLAAGEARPGSEQAQAAGGTVEQILDRTVGPYADDAVRGKVIATMSAPPEAVMRACVRALEHWDCERADTVYAALGLPVLAIQSTYHDRFTPRRSFAHAGETSPYLDHLRGQVRGLEIAILPDTGHFSMMERPQAVTALVRTFAAATTR